MNDLADKTDFYLLGNSDDKKYAKSFASDQEYTDFKWRRRRKEEKEESKFKYVNVTWKKRKSYFISCLSFLFDCPAVRPFVRLSILSVQAPRVTGLLYKERENLGKNE